MNKFNVFSNIDQDNQLESLICHLTNYDKKDILKILPDLNDDIKPVAIISLKSIENELEAKTLIKFLTGQDGRTREAVSCILCETEADLISDEESLNILVNALCDINPNVVRNIINLIKNSNLISEKIEKLVISKTKETLDELSIYLKGPFSDNMQKSFKNHAKNKLTFNLYWLLECISNLKGKENIEDILQKTSCFLDYTIREKTAKILAKMDNPPTEILKKLKQDENFYVKNQLL